MNFYDALALYMAIMSVYGTVNLLLTIRNKLFNRPIVNDSVPTQKTQKPHNDAPKVDKRNKYTVNIAACEAYLAARK